MSKLGPDLVLDFDRIRRLTIVEGALVNETPLRVGVGREAPLGSPVELAVITMKVNGRRRPYIPGSSLKGVFRSFIEQLARSSYPQLHDPWQFNDVENEEKDGFCVVCAIFGNKQVASHVRIYDAMPQSEPSISIRTGVGINREFQAVEPEVYYTEEFVNPGSKWKFRMDILNIEFPGEGDERSRYLRELFTTLKTVGLQVGARRSVGMGLIKLVDAKYKTYSIVDGALKLIDDGEL
ncbi:hypothetical protein HRbin01_01462 [archaeon HR01]|nr:hypothetical protein HRbin01_01462 [archaeon HR01]